MKIALSFTLSLLAASVSGIKLIKNDAELSGNIAEAGSRLVVVNFMALWCGPCQALAPQLNQLASAKPNVVFLSIEVDEFMGPRGLKEYDINAMPTFKFIKNSLVVDTIEGADYARIAQVIEANQ